MKIRMRDGTGTIDLKFLVEDYDRHGNVRVYVRRHGRKIRIRETPGTEEFMAAYRSALECGSPGAPQKPKAVTPGSLRQLIEHYYQSAEYRCLGKDTRRVRKGILDGLCEDHGGKPFALMEPQHVRALRDQKADFPEAANARVKALRQVFKWAVEAGRADRNPAREVPYLRPNNPEGFHAWSIEEVQQFEARHPVGTKARLALALLLYTGVRRSDAVRLGPQMERDGSLCFRETKGQAQRVKDREIPILLELRSVLDATPSGHLNYITTAFGKPYTPAGFGNWFRRRCNEAGLQHCSAHGLRKAGATIAADNGATEHQLMAIFGWDSPKQAALYTRKANRKRLAAEAMHKLVPAKSVPLSKVVVSGGTNRGKKP
jgi:integrase